VPRGRAGQCGDVSTSLSAGPELPEGADESPLPGPGATITPYRDGPLLVRGDFRLVDQDGAEIDPGRHTIALCRCGKSGIKPFCDGSHKRSGFSAPSAPSRPRPAAQIVREARTDD
jgi:CDGSH-type Zn-finger protein